MMRKLFSIFLLGSAVITCAQKPNIIVIYTDDQGYGDTTLQNDECRFFTPHINSIAEEGMRFTDGHSSAAVCSPSRYSLLTGRYSWRSTLKTFVTNNKVDQCVIAPGRMTLASYLRENGYNTAVVGKWHLGMDYGGMYGDRDWSQPVMDGPADRGFDYFFGFDASMNWGPLTFVENRKVLFPATLWTQKKKNDKEIYRMKPPYSDSREGGNSVEVAPEFLDAAVLGTFAEKAVAWINASAEDARNGKPFFLYMPLTSPHYPVCPSDEFRGKSEIGLYGDFMMETDHRVGQVLNAVKEHGLEENTLVVFSSDNGAVDAKRWGGHNGNRGLRAKKGSIHEGGHRVPFFVKWPSVINPGQVSDSPVCQVDLLATLADIVGTPLPENAGEDSFSLLPLFQGEDSFARAPIIHRDIRGRLAIREGDWKLVFPQKAGQANELYNLKTDRMEENNVIKAHPELVEAMEKKMNDIICKGRSNPGKPQINDTGWWKQLTSITESQYEQLHGK